MINKLLKQRYSTRSFSNKKIEDEKIKVLFEAARWSPSSMNEQPWRFIIAEHKNKEAHNKIVNVLNEGNKIWAIEAPLLILSLTKLSHERNGRLNRYAFYDVGQSVAHLTFQATELGLFVRQMGGFNHEKAKALFNIPEQFETVSVIAVGYRNEDIEEIISPRTRLNIDEIVFEDNFGNKSNLFENALEDSLKEK